MATRKVLSVVLAVVVVLASMITVSALKNAISVEVATNSENAYVQEVTITVPVAVSGTMTLQITDPSEEPTVLYAMDDTKQYENTNGVRKYYAEVTMPSDAQTGSYYLWIGNNVEKKSYLFNYTSLDDKIDFYNGLIDAIEVGAAQVGAYLNDPDIKCTAEPAEFEAYKALSDSVKGKVNATLLLVQTDAETENDLTYIGVDGGLNNAQKSATTRENDEIFITAFSDIMYLAVIADASAEEWNSVAESAMSGEGAIFDNKYYTAPEGETALLAADNAYSRFVTEIASLATLDETKLTVAFDKATLLAIADTKDYASVKDAFLYFEDKGSITADMTNIDAIVAAGKDADLWKDLKTSGYTDVESLVDKAEEIAQTMVDNGALSQAPVGGNMPSNTPTTDKPSKPGASMGIVSDPTMTPAEPVNPTQPKPVEGFADLANAEWSREAVEYLADKGVISGKDANTFAPNDAVTREEGAKIIIGAFDLLKEADCEFTDISADRWSYAYIAAAVELGIINGYGDSFGPTDTMTREQAATIIFRAAEKIALELSGEKAEFTDGADTADWAADAVANLAANGVINGMGDGTFAPKATLTRAQLAQLVYNVLVTIGGVN